MIKLNIFLKTYADLLEPLLSHAGPEVSEASPE